MMSYAEKMNESSMINLFASIEFNQNKWLPNGAFLKICSGQYWYIFTLYAEETEAHTNYNGQLQILLSKGTHF